MALALLDCPTGLAGNMLLAALLDLGLPEAAIHAPLAQLGLADRYRLRIEERRSGGLRGLHLEVETLESQPPHRHWGSLRQQLSSSPLDPALRQRVLAVFTLLADAEATVHGHVPEQVHFHEVGALDALVDVVGVCAGLLHFGVTSLRCTVPPAGHGTVQTAHGVLPLPAPAVLEIARRCGCPLGSSEGFPAGELTTPTGLALAACWSDGFGQAPSHVPLRIGVGLGSRSLDRPNLLRLCLARAVEPPTGDSSPEPEAPGAQPRLETIVQQQAQIDDATAEDLAFLAEELRQAGALEVFSQPIGMKKGRLGSLITALVSEPQRAALRQVWWRHSTSLGLREQMQQRWVLPRGIEELSTSLGPVRFKRHLRPDGLARCKAEYDDLAGLARQHGLPLAVVRAVVDRCLDQSGPEAQR
ncbi:nickel pincer cofactor biosynthesis protein LarC [Synechococcus sp. CCY9202]|uniref:nickel pincer cofactor biosynthesis protein LarC n=1 Tax=Synechococcus sp. CCY9202 TaxID=174698 RepID=UPI002B1E9FC5|nr:nickel pincer cofactor biosynthesis protein LarC [Synechococcus sp. CCY9202]MEA5422705.1 nickel pincer cofactor biosynthesis protein LarC [Synechococcus sp. CCY9202]